MILCSPTNYGIWYRYDDGPRDFVYLFDDRHSTYKDFRKPSRQRLAKFLGVQVTQIRTVTLEQFENTNGK